MNEEILLPHIREVRPEDRGKLPVFSHSKLEQFKNCAMAYDFKYNQKMSTKDTSIALELGSLCHLVLEMKGRMLNGEIPFDRDVLDKILEEGYDEVNEKTKDHIPGVKELKSKYWEIWRDPDKEGRTYDEKLKTFQKIVDSEMEDNPYWTPIQFEYSFEFVWDDKVIVHGFIDRIDMNRDGEYRVVDYKTSRKVFDASHLPTSQQFAIYAVAMLLETGKLPVEYQYRFIMIDDEQYALTKGWETRFVKAMNGLLDKIKTNEGSGIWTPKPSPLCYYCPYSHTNPNATIYNSSCEYYSLWTPDKKTFDVNKKFNVLNVTRNNTMQEKPKRKIIF